ncbi:MAG: sugar phosphate isomerase/epimerase family protein [Candidatus Omnitrophota bacterium]
MSDWPVGLSTGCFYNRSIFECLEPIRQGGFSMIEVCSAPDHLDYHDQKQVRRAAEMIKGLGIEAYSFHAPFRHEIDITALDKFQRERSLHELLTAAETAGILNVRYFVVHPGPEKSPNISDQERSQRILNASGVLNEVCRRCRELEIGFVLENMLPHLLFGNTSDMLKIMGSIQEINVGTCLDTGHAHLSGDLYSVMYKLSGHLQMIHAADNHGDWDAHLAPGQGGVDWPRLLRELHETGFHGGLILELAGNEDVSMEEKLDQARQARCYLRDISRRIDLSTPPTVT